MTNRFVLPVRLIALLALAPTSVLAHGAGGVHILGKVTATTEASISVQTKDGKEQLVAIDEKTKIERSGSAADLKDIKVGERVVVHARKEKEKLVAELLKLGKQSKPERPNHAPDSGTKEKEHHDHSNH